MAEIRVLGKDGMIMTEINMPEEVTKGETYMIGVGSVKIRLEAVTVHADKLYRDEVWLRDAYTDRGLTMAELASQFNVSAMTICTWLDKFGIETRPRGRRS